MRKTGKGLSVPETWRRLLPSAICGAGGVLLYLALSAGAGEGSLPVDGKLAREGYGGGETSYGLLVDGLGEEEIPVTVQVGPRQYTQEEAEQVFYDIMDGMEERIRGSNRSLTEVVSDLDLPSAVEEAGVRIRWSSSEPELMDSAGKIRAAVRQAKELTLSAQLTDGIHHADFEMPVRLAVPSLEPGRKQLDALREEIALREERQRSQAYLSLPRELDGKSLRYRIPKQKDYIYLPVLGLLAAMLLAVRGRQESREKEKKREQELLLDYADLVSKLMVFIGAGMTIRNAWERMVKDYDMALRKGRQKPRAAYEEMRQACYQMANGVPEGTAYREFGRRCRLQPYLKLSSLLEQNRRSGTKNLRAIMETEVTDAFELRKNLARRMGEEAGTKLLLPLFLMLGIVMVMIMVPAMMTMG